MNEPIRPHPTAPAPAMRACSCSYCACSCYARLLLLLLRLLLTHAPAHHYRKGLQRAQIRSRAGRGALHRGGCVLHGGRGQTQGARGHCTAMISLFSRKRGRGGPEGANTRPLRVCWRADYINREVRWAPRQVLVLVNHLIDSILECWMPCHFAHITRSASTPFCTHDHLG